MSDRAYANVQVQQKTLIGPSPKSSLLQRTCACGQHTITGGECKACRNERLTLRRSQREFGPLSALTVSKGSSSAQENSPSLNTVVDRTSRFGHDFSQIPIHSTRTAVPQTKLKVNQPGDVYEQEADHVAKQVMRMTGRGLSVSNDEDEATTSLMRTQSGEPGANAATESPGVPPVVHAVLSNGGGQPLDTTTRAFMEPRFGHDFSQVRVHTDARAAESALAVNALAYTVGRDLVFGAGQYAPMTSAGQRLVAHELVHVVQQEGQLGTEPERCAIDPTGSGREQEANSAVQRIAAGLAVQVQPSPQPQGVQLVQRAEKGTYVSTVGDKDYLDGGFNFFHRWGYPNVKRVSNVKEVLDDLDTSKGALEKFRIVSHGSQLGMQIGLLPEVSPEFFGEDTAKLTTPQSFRNLFTGQKLIDESGFKNILDVLRKDANANAQLMTIGVGQDAPDEDSNLGIVLRAMVDQRYIDNAQDKDGKALQIANKALLDQFNASRINTYRPLVVNTFPQVAQAKVTKAFSDLGVAMTTLVKAGNVTFDPLTQQEAVTLADPFIEDKPARGGKQLQPQVIRSIQEGADGPFLKKLRSVRDKVDNKTHIEIRGCNIGGNTATLDAIRGFFGKAGALPSISAPDLFQYFFPLTLTAYGTNQQEEARLQTEYADPATGLSTSFNEGERIRRGEMILVSEETKLDEIATKYGKNSQELRRLNPDLADPDKLTSQDTVWFVRRTSLPAGRYKTLKDFCAQYLGDAKAFDPMKAANPQIQDPDALNSGDKINVPANLLKQPFADVAPPTAQQFSQAIRSGKALVAFGQGSRPNIHLDVTKKETAIGDWLAKQHFDPNGKTAAELTKLYRVKYSEKVAGTYVAFLSQGYPNVTDPIFPDDPRYEKHIIRRP